MDVDDAFRIIEEYKEKVGAVRATQVRRTRLHDSTPLAQKAISMLQQYLLKGYVGLQMF